MDVRTIDSKYQEILLLWLGIDGAIKQNKALQNNGGNLHMQLGTYGHTRKLEGQNESCS